MNRIIAPTFTSVCLSHYQESVLSFYWWSVFQYFLVNLCLQRWLPLTQFQLMTGFSLNYYGPFLCLVFSPSALSSLRVSLYLW